MIQLVVSDIDGTLLQNGARTLSPEVLRQIKKLTEAGILFCAASGREYSNLYRLFKGVQDDIMYICLNGALIIKDKKVICRTGMDTVTGQRIIRDILKRKGCEALVSGESSCYIQPKKLEYVNHMIHYVGNDIRITGDLYHIGEEYLKISAYNPEGIGPDAVYFTGRWVNKVPSVVSGQCWFDFTAPYVNKGNALAVVQKILHIAPEDTVVLGDHFNDLEMFEHAYFSYAMAAGQPEVKKQARFIASDVESVLFDILRMR